MSKSKSDLLKIMDVTMLCRIGPMKSGSFCDGNDQIKDIVLNQF